MNNKVFLIVAGSIFLALGLYLNFKSLHLRDIVMGRRKYGLPGGDVYKEEDYKKKKENFKISQLCYYWGMGLTLLGIILNTYGALF
ncbi:MAG: hypothetical protein AABY43_05550 [Candidatus Omnitrophota bacterium]